MKKILLMIAVASLSMIAYGQTQYLTRTGRVSLVAPYNNVGFGGTEASNFQATSLLDTGSGKVAFKVPIKSFEFSQANMQSSFNETYMESAMYPEATFDGSIENMGKVTFTKSGTYNVSLKGTLKIHGVSKNVTVPGTVIVDTKKNTVTLKATFEAAFADYGIKQFASGKFPEKLEVRVESEMSPKK